MAQVYSVNAVGYVNVTLKAGFNLVANPLDAGAGNNTVEKLLTGMPDGVVVYTYTAAGGYVVNSYDSSLGGWDNAAMTLVPGQGFWLLLPAGADKTVTFVGDVPQGTLTVNLDKGFTLVGSKVPQAGKLQADLKYTPATGDVIYKYANPGGYSVVSFDPDLGGWDPGDPSIAVAEGFWTLKVASGSWTRDFSVNQ